MPTAPTPITPYATPPNSNDPTNFDARADAKVADDVTKVVEYNALAENVFDNAVEAAGAASAAEAAQAAAELAQAGAAASAAASAASAGAEPWVSGSAYTAGDVAWSPISRLSYRRTTNGGGTTDPSLDSGNWAALSARPALNRLALMNQGVI